MCGRYYVGEKLIEQVRHIVPSIQSQLEYSYCGDITPAMKAPVIAGRNNKPVLELMTWGFQKFEDKGLIINARSETVSEKRLFKECFLHRRILLPASGFYEWDKSKNKVTFTLEDSPVLFLAGFYQRTDETPEGQFVVLTTAANASMEPVYDRMPLLIEKKDITLWLNDESAASELARGEMPELAAHREFEQMTLF